MKCKQCGAEIFPGDEFCGNCGSKVEASEENSEYAGKLKENLGLLKQKWHNLSQKQKMAAIGIAVLVVILLVKGIGTIIGLFLLALVVMALYELFWYQGTTVNQYINDFEVEILDMPEGMHSEDVFRLIQEKLMYPHKKMQVKLGIDGSYVLQIETKISGSIVEIRSRAENQKECLIIIPAGKMLSVSYPEARMIKNEISKILFGCPADIDVQAETIRIKRWGFDLKAIRILKRFRLAITLALILFAVTYVYFAYSHQYVDYVKNGSPYSYPDITYEQAFDSFFKRPKWKSFEAENGEQIVEFSGRCLYQEQEVTVTMQFIVDTEGSTFELTYCAMNDIPQNIFVATALVSKAFESY